MGGRPSRPSTEQARQLRNTVDASCAAAAATIAQADVLLFCTGAGFDADSGLAVYADVAKVPAYAKRGFTYSSLCDERLLHWEPEVFWGFWGQCFNDYRETAPHDGYRIVNSWAEKLFRHSSIGKLIRNAGPQLALKYQEEHGKGPEPTMELSGSDPYQTTDQPGAFFVFTSNVSGHCYDWYEACEIRECHGSTELYQCAAQDRCRHVWRAPFDFRFFVGRTTMLAPLLDPNGVERGSLVERDCSTISSLSNIASPHVPNLMSGQGYFARLATYTSYICCTRRPYRRCQASRRITEGNTQRTAIFEGQLQDESSTVPLLRPGSPASSHVLFRSPLAGCEGSKAPLGIVETSCPEACRDEAINVKTPCCNPRGRCWSERDNGARHVGNVPRRSA